MNPGVIVPGSIIGLKIYYGDGSIRQARVAPNDFEALRTAWESWSGTNVQYVVLAYDATYWIWKQSYNENGRPVNQQRVTEHYCDGLHSAEFYYYDPATQTFGTSQRSQDVPPGAVTKRASAIADATWRLLYNAAKEDRQAPAR